MLGAGSLAEHIPLLGDGVIRVLLHLRPSPFPTSVRLFPVCLFSCPEIGPSLKFIFYIPHLCTQVIFIFLFWILLTLYDRL